LYQTEALELLRLNYHHMNATFLDPSALLLLSYVRVTDTGSSTLTRPASLHRDRCLPEPHSVEHLFQYPACPTQLKTYGMIQTRQLIFPSSMTTVTKGGELWATTTTTTTISADVVTTTIAPQHLVSSQSVLLLVSEQLGLVTIKFFFNS